MPSTFSFSLCEAGWLPWEDFELPLSSQNVGWRNSGEGQLLRLEKISQRRSLIHWVLHPVRRALGERRLQAEEALFQTSYFWFWNTVGFSSPLGFSCREFARWKVNNLALERKDFFSLPLPLAPEFVRNIRLLGRRPNLQQVTENLIKKYGTHFLLSATLGGKQHPQPQPIYCSIVENSFYDLLNIVLSPESFSFLAWEVFFLFPIAWEVFSWWCTGDQCILSVPKSTLEHFYSLATVIQG